MVQLTPGSADKPHHSASEGASHLPPLGPTRTASNLEKFKSLHCCSLRKMLKSKQLSEQVTNFLCKHKSQRSVAACAAHVNRWIQFCLERQIHPCEPTLEQYYMYLQDVFPNPGSLNAYISGMKKYLSEKSLALFNHLFFDELKTASRMAAAEIPKLPAVSWDPDTVLDYMLTLPDPAKMNKVELSGCCLVLLLLSSGRWKIDLFHLDMSERHMQKTEDCFYFTMRELSKCHRGHKKNDFMQYIEFPKYSFDKRICPYYMLECYIKYIRNRCPTDLSKLFVRTTDGGPAHPDSLRRWGCIILEKAGVIPPLQKGVQKGVKRLTVSSTRSAHALKVFQMGKSFDSIMERCTWTTKSTFFKHYCKPIKSTLINKAQQI